jgi:hypothetical protein
MILILKNKKNQPKSWELYSKTPGVDYAPSSDLRNALLKEQGYICAFCMRTIPVRKKDPNDNERSKIAHLLSRTNHDDKKLDYDNMVICCPGNINGEAHCDKSQGSTDIRLPMFNIQLQKSIEYSSHTGEIKSKDNVWHYSMDKTLNLNNILLKYNRLYALNGVQQILEDKKWTKAQIQEKLDEWSNLNNGKLKPYCGIVIWYLEKKLRQMH